MKRIKTNILFLLQIGDNVAYFINMHYNISIYASEKMRKEVFIVEKEYKDSACAYAA